MQGKMNKGTNKAMIRNLVFDLGGVLLNIDFKRTYDAFDALDKNQAYHFNEHPEVLGLFMALETGEFTPEGFRSQFRLLTGYSGSDNDLDRAFNALLVGFPPERIARVQELALKYNTFILSNTNAIHCRHYNELLYDTMGIPDLDQLVKKAYYSHEMQARKPDPEIFLRMVSHSGMKPEESLFIDDREENIEAARKLGFEVMLVDEEHTILEVLADL